MNSAILKHLPEYKRLGLLELLEMDDKTNIDIFLYSILPDIEKIIEDHVKEILPRINLGTDSY